MDEFLGISLNDQLAAGVLWCEVARRSLPRACRKGSITSRWRSARSMSTGESALRTDEHRPS